MQDDGWFDENGDFHEGKHRELDEYEEAWGFSYEDETLFPNEGD